MLRDPTLDLFKYSSFPTLAASIRERKELILRRWQQVVPQKLPHADELTLEQLRDEMPKIIDELADALEACDGGAMANLKATSRDHGADRFHHSYSVNEVLVEFGLLRPIMIDEVAASLDRDLSVEENAALNMGIDTAVRRSVTEFASHQQKLIQSAGDAQTKYLSFLSHDLRGGLNGVLLTAELLRREFAGQPQFADSIEDLDSMRRSILDTVATMDRFLHAERFRQGKVKTTNTAIHLRPVITGLAAQFTHLIKDKGISLEFEIPDDLEVITDKEMLGLILQNLISNAIKYTPKGAVHVSACVAEPSKGTRISVKDAGPGIPVERVPALFEAFTRGDTHGQPGVGLGLYIVRQAADLIAAKLSVESAPEKGSTFHVELPAP